MARGQVVNIPLAGGLQEHEDPVLTTSLLQCRNGVYRKNGSVDKRYGIAMVDKTNAIANTSSLYGLSHNPPIGQPTIPVPEECIEYNGSLVRIGGGDIYTYNATTGTNVFGGSCSNVTVSADYVPSQAGGGIDKKKLAKQLRAVAKLPL